MQNKRAVMFLFIASAASAADGCKWLMKATESRSVPEAAVATELVSRRGAATVWIGDRSGGCTVGQLESATPEAIRLRDKSGIVRTVPTNSTARIGWRRGNRHLGVLFTALVLASSVPLGFATGVGTDSDIMLPVVAGGGIAAGVILGKKIIGRREVWVIERGGG